MTTAPPLTLQPAEFYFLHEGRDESELIYNLNQVEVDPRETTRIAREIARRRMKVDPDWTPYEISPPYFGLPNVEMDPELVLAATAFAAPRPPLLAHFDFIMNPSEGHTSAYYEIVSAEWKAAIESVEPGVHQFFPHELRFADSVVSDRFIFRCRTQLDDVKPYYHVDAVHDVWNDVVGYRFVVNETFSAPTLERGMVAGRHLLHGNFGHARFVSHALAERLLPLLHERVALLPVALTGAAPERVPFLSPAMVDEAAEGIIETSSDGRPAPGGLGSSEPPSPSPLDPELADAIAAINGASLDFSLDAKARATLESRLEGATVERIFVIIAEALKFDVPLEKNFSVNLSVFACHERDERELLPYCRAWAADPSPLRRVTAARVLSRQIPRSEGPHPETFSILTGLLDDRDPNVVAEMIGILFWMRHPAYSQALRSRRDQFAHHESAKVREFCRGLIDGEPEQATQTVPDFSGEEAESLFASSFVAMRTGDGFEPRLEALRHRDAADLVAVAARWAEDANPDKRMLAAQALERPWGNPTRASRLLIQVLRKLSGDSDAAVAETAVKALDSARGQSPVIDEDLENVQAASAHHSAAARAAYAESPAIGQSPEALDALLTLAYDPDKEVRRNVALHLTCYIEDGVSPRPWLMRDTLARLASDPDRLVRYFAIDAFVRFDDPRVVDAIARELDGPEEELASVYEFILPCVLAKPNERYLDGLESMNAKFRGNPGIDEAIGACRRAKPRPPSAQGRS